MGHDAFEITVNVVKMLLIFLMMVQAVPLLVWVERRGSAFIQNRYGPNRIGPLGLTQLLADAFKFLFKEEFVPEKGVRLLYFAAPIAALIPGALAFGSIPLSLPIDIAPFTLLGHPLGPYRFAFQSFELDLGIVFVLGVSSLGTYALLMAGWGSSNKYSLLGALRASAQAISYELALSLSLVGIILVFGTLNFREMVEAQAGPLHYEFLGHSVTIPFLPNWGIFFQPLGAVLFFAATFAESNRLPFDLAEAEGELVAGFHTEYAGFKMLMFYIGEYGHMMVASALLATFYFGGYTIPGVSGDVLRAFWGGVLGQGNTASVMVAFTYHLSLLVKIAFFLWVFVWVRWTLPRFRYDQLMNLGWKTMLPWALFNAILTAVCLWIVHRPGQVS